MRYTIKKTMGGTCPLTLELVLTRLVQGLLGLD